MAKSFTYSTNDSTLANCDVRFYREPGSGMRFRIMVVSDDGAWTEIYDEDLSDALTAMVGAGAITGAQRTAFQAVASALRQRARAGTNMI